MRGEKDLEEHGDLLEVEALALFPAQTQQDVARRHLLALAPSHERIVSDCSRLATKPFAAGSKHML